MWVIDFGLADTAFWAATPRDFLRMQQVWEQREKREYLRAGTIAAAMYNAFGASKQPVGPEDIFPVLDEGQRTISSKDAQLYAQQLIMMGAPGLRAK